MKTRKIIVALLMSVLLLPSMSFAQTATTVSPTHDELVMKLIIGLMEQIKILQDQLAKIQGGTNSTAMSDNGLTVSLSKVDKKADSAQIHWITSIPATSKVVISKTAKDINSTRISNKREILSSNGTSTKGLANIKNLEQNTKYYYLIKATTEDSYVELGGTFTTEKSAEQIAKEKAELKAQKQQSDLIEKLNTLNNEARAAGCAYSRDRYQRDTQYRQQWIKLIDELKNYGGTYESSCLFDAA